MISTFRFWADRGVDGFRLDVFNEYFKDDQYRDNPRRFGLRPFDQQRHVFDADRPEMMGVVQEIRSTLDGYPERYAVGETFLAEVKKTAEYCAPGKLHAAFNFSFTHNPWNPAKFLQSILDWEAVLPVGSWPNYVLNNHDTPRSATRFHAPQNDERLKVAAGMLLTLRGTPFLYFGEEIGMRDIPLSRSDFQDPVGLRYWPLIKGRDGCRSPMQWSAASHAGFSTVKPWLKVHPDFISRNFELQKQDPDSLYNFYRKMIRLRRTFPALQKGMFLPLTYDPRQVLGYLRQDEGQTILVALNFGRRKIKLALGPQLMDSKWELLLSNKHETLPEIKKGWLHLLGDEVCILLQK